MSQAELIGASLIAAFLLFLAAKQRLGVYWSLLTGGAAQGGTSGSASGSAAPSTGTAGQGGSILPAPGSVGSPVIPIPGTPGIALPANPLTTPEPGYGFPGN